MDELELADVPVVADLVEPELVAGRLPAAAERVMLGLAVAVLTVVDLAAVDLPCGRELRLAWNARGLRMRWFNSYWLNSQWSQTGS